ncbi:hypothetical protein KC902_03295 [Candidatus Kaiserbacteria bacterium]|nr:hypothetical protein [Candidatus Kaiserbacteria bacterium]USN88406.1 MAG: hypothetical protein H6780_02815 [Candidatus Nomurabacteria bacterium]
MSTRKSSSKKQASGQQKKTSVVKQARVNRRLRAAAKRLAREKSRQGHQQATLNGFVHHQRTKGKKVSKREAAKQLLA